MKHKKVKVILLCMAAAGVMAGCSAGSGSKDTGKTSESQSSPSSAQEKTSVDSGKVDKEEKSADGETDKGLSGSKDEKDQSEKNGADAAEKDTQVSKASRLIWKEAHCPFIIQPVRILFKGWSDYTDTARQTFHQ
ncbi:MAG: hypothetical protein Q4D16_21630, partial [Eubacteriales bacterium]|nr:hypothetical protein [Eubacteriales bacterium]